jgi:hypothetical protein
MGLESVKTVKYFTPLSKKAEESSQAAETACAAMRDRDVTISYSCVIDPGFASSPPALNCAVRLGSASSRTAP